MNFFFKPVEFLKNILEIKMTQNYATYTGNNWMSPFGTQINCIDSIDAECKRGLTLEQCMKKCEDSNQCNVGYFIETDRPGANEPSYCVPLSSYSWGNQNIFDILFSNQNPTNLSTTHGIKYTLFYNDKKFIPTNNLPSDYDKFLFSMSNIYLKYNSPRPRYLSQSLRLVRNKKNALVIKVTKVDRVFVTTGIRLTKDMNICFFQYNFLVVLQVTAENKIIWESVQPLKTIFQILDKDKKKSTSFLNSNEKIYLKHEDMFLCVKHNKLALCKKAPKHLWQLEIINVQDPNKGRKIYTRTNDFYCRNFECKKPIIPIKRNYAWIVAIVLIILFILTGLILLVMQTVHGF